MNVRQIIMLMIVSTGSFLLIAGGAFVYYKIATAPPPPKEVTEKKQKEIIQKVSQDSLTAFKLITDKLFELENLRMEKDYNAKITDSLYKNIKYWQDSAWNSTQKYIPYLKDSISKWVSWSNKLKDSIKILKDSYANSNQTIESLKKQIEDKNKALIRKQDSTAKNNYNEFASIYDKTEPKEVAKILEKIDEKDAAYILKKMKKKLAGKVIESMNKEKAAAILAVSSVY